MNPLKVKLNFQCVAGDIGGVIVTGVSKSFEFDSNGKRTSKQNGIIYNAVSKFLGYEPLKIRVFSAAKPVITQEEIDSSKDPIFITCQGFVGKFYRDASGIYQLSCTAESVSLLDEMELEM